VREMTYGQLFMSAPSTRQEVSYRLVHERPPRKGKAKEKRVSLTEPVFPPDQPGKVEKALPESVGRIVNFYTTTHVTEAGGNYPAGIQKRVLVDGGSVPNMMPLSLARRMDLI